ncbi:MAG: dihydroorotate dehydrogenase electron transfer subunit [Nocardioides sp.]|nr:dihydroorotate dehydrogenase electron transfer subunit [Nocardioides sp.]
MGERDPRHVVGEVLATRRAGAFRHLTLTARGIPERFRPGTFVAVSVAPTQMARRALWIHRVSETGTFGPTLDVVVEPRGIGGRWLAEVNVGSRLELTGPLGRPFAIPKEPVACLLVGEGCSAAPLFPLAERLRDRRAPVSFVLAGADESHLLAPREARRMSRSVQVVTADGSVGNRGDVMTVLRTAIEATEAAVVYAAGPTRMLRAVAEAAEEAGVQSQVAIEQPLSCGTGLCRGCVIDVRDAEGDAHQVRACLDGPVLPGDRVDWASLLGDAS